MQERNATPKATASRHQGKPRPLRLLLIDDQPEGGICNRHLAVCRVSVPPQGEQTSDRLSEWRQHLWLWHSGSLPEFELLGIDIKFDRDTTAPDYPGVVAAAEAPRERAKSPLGLLHALPLVAVRQARTSLPFAWVIYSSMAGDVKNDCVAQVSYGLLRCMEGGVDWTDEFHRRPAQHFSNELAQMQYLPGTLIGTLLGRFRHNLTQACRQGRVSVILDGDFRALLDCPNLPALADKGVVFSAQDGERCLSLRSLFADLDRFDAPEELALVRKFLEGLAEATLRVAPSTPVVACCLRQLLHRMEGVRDVLPEDAPNKLQIGVGVLLCRWLMLHRALAPRQEEISRKAFLASLGYEPNGQSALDRLFADAKLGCTLGKFLDSLKGPYPALPHYYRTLGHEFYTDPSYAEFFEGEATPPPPRPAWLDHPAPPPDDGGHSDS